MSIIELYKYISIKYNSIKTNTKEVELIRDIQEYIKSCDDLKNEIKIIDSHKKLYVKRKKATTLIIFDISHPRKILWGRDYYTENDRRNYYLKNSLLDFVILVLFIIVLFAVFINIHKMENLTLFIALIVELILLLFIKEFKIKRNICHNASLSTAIGLFLNTENADLLLFNSSTKKNIEYNDYSYIIEINNIYLGPEIIKIIDEENGKKIYKFFSGISNNKEKMIINENKFQENEVPQSIITSWKDLKSGFRVSL